MKHLINIIIAGIGNYIILQISAGIFNEEPLFINSLTLYAVFFLVLERFDK